MAVHPIVPIFGCSSGPAGPSAGPSAGLADGSAGLADGSAGKVRQERFVLVDLVGFDET